MPIYEFECLKCHKEFEELVFGSDPDVRCPECSGAKLKRLLSRAAIKSGSKFKSTASSSGSCSGCSSGSCGSCGH